MIMLTTAYLLQNIQVNSLTSYVRVLFNFDLSTVYAKQASNNQPQINKCMAVIGIAYFIVLL